MATQGQKQEEVVVKKFRPKSKNVPGVKEYEVLQNTDGNDILKSVQKSNVSSSHNTGLNLKLDDEALREIQAKGGPNTGKNREKSDRKVSFMASEKSSSNKSVAGTPRM